MKKLDNLVQKKYLKRGILVFALLVAAFFVLNDVLMPWYVHGRDEVQIPSVIGIPFDEATRILDSAGLDPRQGDVLSDPKYPIGTVISQNPGDNKYVRKGRRVYLTLSGGERHVTVPNLRGRTLRDAKFQLEREGLKVGRITYEGSDEFPQNTIIRQSVPPRQSIKRGVAISVVVSEGRVSEKIAVPELVNKTLTEAQKILTSMGLKVGNITYQSLPDVLPNTVVDQFPRVGEMIQIGGTIDLFVALEGDKQQPIDEN
ncbi:MAG: PASTA domain-containing protein [Bacteroidetes bacterium]|nr:MAG: PASTA domain-containing protein [Bacteroidota bacterium]